MTIQYNEYLNVSDYRKNLKAKTLLKSSSKTYPINSYKLFRSAATVGLSSKGLKALPREVRRWKMDTVKTFTELSKGTGPAKFTNLQDLESSEKGAVSYLLGMIFAHLLIQEKFKVRHLEHLNSPGIHPVHYSKNKKKPDFWGYNRSSSPPYSSYLVEAKGSSKSHEYFNFGAIEDAEEQLSSIKQIGYTTSSGVSLVFNELHLKNLEKLIIATHPNIQNEITQKIIDPKNYDEIEIIIDGDQSVFKYYYNLILWLESAISREVTIELNNEKKSFVITDIPDSDISVGVLKDIFDYLRKNIKTHHEYKSEDFIGVDHQVNKILDRFDLTGEEGSYKNFSLGIDGVIALDRTMEGSNFTCFEGNLVYSKIN